MNEQFEHGTLRRPVVAAIALVVGAIVLAAVTPSFAEEKTKPPQAPPHIKIDATDCRCCHACDKPTTRDPCLHACRRPRERDITKELQKGPVPQGIILLDMLSNIADAKDHFGPVPFDHTGHAKWAEIAGGCTICHHYTPEGAAHPACRTCHELEFLHVDISKPGLKGAYHRQCMGCHREWSHDTRCGACHLPRVREDQQPRDADTITKDDALARMHQPCPAPEAKVYQTNYPEDVGSKVYFHHQRHTQIYQFECTGCHQGDSCTRCHEVGRKQVPQVCTAEERHKLCSACHQIEDVCGRCHKQPGEPEPAPFEHASTGWPLGRYHAKTGCRTCHTEMPFRKLDRDCNSCHSDWEPDSFDHAVTGQALDENHAEIDCSDCHADRKFDVAPRCDECHDEDEGFVVPQKRPGLLAEPKK